MKLPHLKLILFTSLCSTFFLTTQPQPVQGQEAYCDTVTANRSTVKPGESIIISGSGCGVGCVKVGGIYDDDPDLWTEVTREITVVEGSFTTPPFIAPNLEGRLEFIAAQCRGDQLHEDQIFVAVTQDEPPPPPENDIGSCESFTVSPKSAPSSSTFTFVGNNCSSKHSSVRLVLYNPAGEIESSIGLSLDLNGNFSRTASGFTMTGNYQAKLIEEVGYGGDHIAGPISFTVTEVVPASCGDQVPYNHGCPESCPKQETYPASGIFECKIVCGSIIPKSRTDRCPQRCPAKRVSETEFVCKLPDNKPIPWDFCKQAGPLADQCNTCQAKNGVWTAVGCIQTSQQGIAKGITTVLISVAGGFALLLILYGAFTITTAQANPEKLQNGRTILTSAIIGLIFILLSVVILRFVGIEILQLPGFGT